MTLSDIVDHLKEHGTPGERIFLHRDVKGSCAEHGGEDCWCEPLVFAVEDFVQVPIKDLDQLVKARIQ